MMARRVEEIFHSKTCIGFCSLSDDVHPLIKGVVSMGRLQHPVKAFL